MSKKIIKERMRLEYTNRSGETVNLKDVNLNIIDIDKSKFNFSKIK